MRREGNMEQDFEIVQKMLIGYHGPGGEVIVPETVEKIAASAFRGNRSVEKVVLPKGICYIEDGAFGGCVNLRQFEVPEDSSNCTADGPFLFARLYGFFNREGSVYLLAAPSASGTCTLPENVEAIRSRAFQGCVGLEKLVIPAGTERVGADSFLGCDGLREIQVETGNEELQVINGALFAKGYNGLEPVFVPRGLTQFTVPQEVKRIGEDAFRNHTELEQIEIPASVEWIADGAFQGCVNLREFKVDRQNSKFHADGLTLLEKGWMESTYGTLLCAPAASGVYQIPEKIISIDRFAFAGCTALEEVVFNRKLTQVGDGAFTGCVNLRTFTTGENPRFLGEGPILYQHWKGEDERAHLVCMPSASGVLEIPAGVERIENCAFQGCAALTSVSIPESVTNIEERAFEDCVSLTSVSIPESVTNIGENTFKGCVSLTSVSIPKSVTDIGESAFEGCAALTSAALPAGLRDLGKNVFLGCWNLDPMPAPDGIQYMDHDYGEGEDYHILPPSTLFQSGKKVPARLTDAIQYTWKDAMTSEDWAGLYLFQTAKAFSELCREHMPDQPAEIAQAMVELLANSKKASVYQRAATYVLDHLGAVKRETVQALYDDAAGKKAKEAAKLLKPALHIASKVDPDSPYAFLYQSFHEVSLNNQYKNLFGPPKLLKEVKLQDGSPAPEFVTLCAIVPYATQYAKPKDAGKYAASRYFSEFEFVPAADQAAALLDQNSLHALLGKLVEIKPAWLVPYGRYARGEEVKSLLSDMNSWMDWYCYGSNGRANIITARGALMLNDTRETLLYMDKGDFLDEYAELRHTTADDIRDTVLAEFGLDQNGKKVYDLGGNTVTVTMSMDLTLTVFDENAQKIVKSIPKKGADPEKVEAARTDLAGMKKNIKKVVKSRCDLLFEQFLDGSTRPGESWKKAYLQNPVLRQVASLLVWSQDGKTFSVKDGQPIDCQEQPYTISKAEVAVAHPMEMPPEDVDAWQKYFTSHGIRQPFAQIWEPVVPAEAIRPDRYKGCQVPAYRFKGKEKHGISFDYSFGASELSIWFCGCHLEIDPGDALGRHELNLQGLMTLGKFTLDKDEYTRQVCHLVAYLDQITMFDRIKKDDPSIAASLEFATLAQVTQYLNFAIENQSTNATAVLLDVKNRRFPDLDPLAEFTLDDL